MVFPPWLMVADGSFPVHLILPQKPEEISKNELKKGIFGQKEGGTAGFSPVRFRRESVSAIRLT